MNLEEKTIASQKVFSGRIVSLRVDTVLLPNGKRASREIIEHNGAVAIVALDDENNIYLVRQYRKAAQKVMLEIPAGTLDPGEEPLAAAKRELREEIGARAGHWEKICSYYSSPGFCTEELTVYLAAGLTAGDPDPDPDEFLEITKMPLEQAFDLVRQNEIMDGKSIIGIQYAYWSRQNERAEK
ncbi:MAG: NUDIX hydrolase [Syntrophomonadaceae bacterium]|jgi:ADP-ribose pyrophosphatase|nr:NUDIX hydrolase [Syntrophomonadaceae bacterium]